MRTRPMLVATALSAFLVLGAAPAMAAPTTDRASLSTANVQGNGSSLGSSISKDGKIVAFESQASNLVANDLNGAQDIFVRNRPSGKTSRVSKRSNGGEANGSSSGPHLSETGRFVAFTSSATNLVGLDGNSASDVFVHDRVSKKTKRVSTRSNGAEANSDSVLQGISADGRYVVFYSFASNLVAGDSNGAIDVFVKDRKSGKTKRVSRRTNGAQGNSPSHYSAISPNGRYVAFASDATNLVPNDSNGTTDVFVHDRKSKKTVRASIASNGAQSNGTSFWPDVANNGSVAFPSVASNLVSNDTNAAWDVFLHNLGTRKTRRVSVSSAGIQANGHSSIAFGPPRISADGKRIAFDSFASNLVAGDTNGAQDAFLHNRANQTTRRVSVRFDGTQGNNTAFVTDISSGGRFVTFLSNATNLVGGDTNAQYDVFVRGPFN
jgi:WD40-like Beta Propeller Repeat